MMRFFSSNQLSYLDLLKLFPKLEISTSVKTFFAQHELYLFAPLFPD